MYFVSYFRSAALADLYCYSCFSYESWEKCWENRRKVQCAWRNDPRQPAFDACIKFEVDVNIVESHNGTQKHHVVQNKGYGMDCGHTVKNCFLQKCRNYWGAHGQIMESGCKVECCQAVNSTCAMPDQTPIKTGFAQDGVLVGARASHGMQLTTSGWLVTLSLLTAQHLWLLFN